MLLLLLLEIDSVQTVAKRRTRSIARASYHAQDIAQYGLRNIIGSIHNRIENKIDLLVEVLQRR